MITLQHVFRNFICALTVTLLVLCLNPGKAALAEDTGSVKNLSNHEFKDPYEGGEQLPDRGGEPGKAYMSLLDAAEKKDSKQICELMTKDENDLKECLKNEKIADGIALWLGNPRGQKILDGYFKGDNATLDVSYSHEGGPDSYASVRMKKEGEKWIWDGFSASGSGEVGATVSGTADLSTTPASEEEPVAPGDCPMLGKWEFVGKDNTGETWKGIIEIKTEDGDTVCDINIQGPKFSSGVGGSLKCNPGMKSFAYTIGGNSFTADLSGDGKNMTNGIWKTEANDFTNFPEVNGTWAATLLE